MRVPCVVLLCATAACGAAESAVPSTDSVRWPVQVERTGEERHQYDRVVLVTIDTLRADHVSCYGYPRATTPFLDTLAARGARFTRAMATASQTAASHATMLTGLVPAVHGVLENGEVLDPAPMDLAELYAAGGFETAAFVNVRFLAEIAASFGTIAVRAVSKERHLQTGADVVDAALAWLAEPRPSPRFFLWVHLYDPHKWKDRVLELGKSTAPLWSGDTPPGFLERVAELHGLPAPRAGEPYTVAWRVKRSDERLDFESAEGFLRCIDAYDELTLFADRQLARLYQAIEARAPAGRTLWIVTADHGEGLASHGVAGHGGRIYQEQLRVPLVLHASDGSITPRVVDELVSHVDLLPTLAETLGVRAIGEAPLYEGRSLWPLLRGADAAWTARAAFAQRRPALDGNDPDGGAAERAEAYALQTSRAKYILHEPGADEFYDLVADPKELVNLGPEATAAAELRAELERRMARFQKLPRAESSVPDDLQEELRRLGYAR